MGLLDLEGDVVATKMLKEKIDLQIIVITADEKQLVFILLLVEFLPLFKKPFTIDEFKKTIDIAKSEYSLLQ